MFVFSRTCVEAEGEARIAKTADHPKEDLSPSLRICCYAPLACLFVVSNSLAAVVDTRRLLVLSHTAGGYHDVLSGERLDSRVIKVRRGSQMTGIRHDSQLWVRVICIDIFLGDRPYFGTGFRHLGNLNTRRHLVIVDRPSKTVTRTTMFPTRELIFSEDAGLSQVYFSQETIYAISVLDVCSPVPVYHGESHRPA